MIRIIKNILPLVMRGDNILRGDKHLDGEQFTKEVGGKHPQVGGTNIFVEGRHVYHGNHVHHVYQFSILTMSTLSTKSNITTMSDSQPGFHWLLIFKLMKNAPCWSDIDDSYCNILLAHNIDVLRHIIVLLLCIVKEN